MPFLKRNLDGELKPYSEKTLRESTGESIEAYIAKEKEWIVGERDIEENPSDEPNIECSCGQKELLVCWWDYPYTGGLCKLRCPKCGNEIVLIDDYS